MMTVRTQYRQLAYVYDRLMESAPYDLWIDWSEAMWRFAGLKPRRLLDLACGTGTLTWRFAEREIEKIYGVDLSHEMLAVAQKKRDTYQQIAHKVTWLEQDMRQLTIPDPVDTVVCFCDSLNYLLEESDWLTVFRRVHHCLQLEGLFLFDIHSPYKIHTVFGNETFAWEEGGVYCVWHNWLDDTRLQVEEELTLFVACDDDTYERFDELHVQRTFPVSTITTWLNECGFDVLRVCAEFRIDEGIEETDERIFFCCRKR